jgi:hypothetical protein
MEGGCGRCEEEEQTLFQFDPDVQTQLEEIRASSGKSPSHDRRDRRARRRRVMAPQ